MQAAKVFATPVQIDLPSLKGELNPITFEVISKIAEIVTQEKLSSVPSVSELMANVKASGDEFRKMMAEAAYLVSDLRCKAKSVEIGDVLSRLNDPIIVSKLIEWNLSKSDKSEVNPLDVSAVMFFVMRKGMEDPRCNLKRWFEISGVAEEESDPTKSEIAS